MKTATANADRSTARSGFTLIELMVVVVMIGILVAMSAPSFRQAIEQSKADLACTNLRSIWAAERLYWLEYQVYKTDLSVLKDAGLLDAQVLAADGPYLYAVSALDSSGNFTSATATRMFGGSSYGAFMISSSGTISGAVTVQGLTITPASFW